MSCDSRKWDCQHCTYLNWPAALRCTMCREPKPPHKIEEAEILAISSLAPDDDLKSTETTEFSLKAKNPPAKKTSDSDVDVVLPLNDSKQPGPQKSKKEKSKSSSANPVSNDRESLSPSKSKKRDKNSTLSLRIESLAAGSDSKTFSNSYQLKPTRWTCESCNVSNGPSESSCTRCKAERIFVIDQPNDDTKPQYNQEKHSIRINDYAYSDMISNTVDNSSNIKGAAYKPPTKNVQNSVEHGKKSRNSSGESTCENNAKWLCSLCTFANWQKSNKCVMCYTSRGDNQLITLENDVVPSSALCKDSGFESNTSLARTITPPISKNLGVSVDSDRGASFNDTRFDLLEHTVNDSYSLNLYNNCSLDSRWLNACRGVVDGKLQPVEEYLTSGGDPARQLTQSEVMILNRPSAFDPGFTLVHLALRFHQENVLAILLSQVDGAPSVTKRVPSYAAPDIAGDIRRIAMSSIRQRKGNFRCYYTTEHVTFTLPSEIEDWAPDVQETLFDEVLDRDVQKELENGQIVNWSLELTDQLNSRLYALWNRSAGDCLLDSVLQATWGIFDRDNGLRRTLSDSLQECATFFYQRWKENELFHAHLLNFSLNEAQCSADWAKLLALASQPGSSLEQLHIFALAHILRRPIIVYGVKYVKSFRGETLGFARYEGVYLPFFWDPGFCWKCPIALGYTRGHFSALVPMEPDCDPLSRLASASRIDSNDINSRSTYLPLTSIDGNILPVHFLTESDIGKEEMILNQWLDVCYTTAGFMIARQKIHKRPLLVAQMVEEWLNHYRQFRQMNAAPYLRQATSNCFSSDGESEND